LGSQKVLRFGADLFVDHVNFNLRGQLPVVLQMPSRRSTRERVGVQVAVFLTVAIVCADVNANEVTECIARFCPGELATDDKVCGAVTPEEPSTVFASTCHAACNGVMTTGPCPDQSVVCPSGVSDCHRCKQTDDLKVSCESIRVVCWVQNWMSQPPSS
jgi:hypothetical protein